MLKQAPIKQASAPNESDSRLVLSEQELVYLQQAIDTWKDGAEKWIKNLEQNASNYYNEDHYDPMPPGRCIYLTRNQIIGAQTLAQEIHKTWQELGSISQEQLSRVLRVSVHTDMHSPLLLSIKHKIELLDNHKSKPSVESVTAPVVQKPLLFSKRDNEPKVEPDNEPPEELCCPITMDLFDEPYFDLLSEKTYSKSGLVEHYQRTGRSPNNVELNGRSIEDVISPDNAMTLRVKAFKERHGISLGSSAVLVNKLI